MTLEAAHTENKDEDGYTEQFPKIRANYKIQNPFLTAQSTQIKSVISVPIKDFIHHYPRALFNDIPMVGAHFYDIPGSGRTFTTYPGRDALLRHTRVGTHFYDIPGSEQITNWEQMQVQSELHHWLYVTRSLQYAQNENMHTYWTMSSTKHAGRSQDA